MKKIMISTISIVSVMMLVGMTCVFYLSTGMMKYLTSVENKYGINLNEGYYTFNRSETNSMLDAVYYLEYDDEVPTQELPFSAGGSKVVAERRLPIVSSERLSTFLYMELSKYILKEYIYDSAKGNHLTELLDSDTLLYKMKKQGIQFYINSEEYASQTDTCEKREEMLTQLYRLHTGNCDLTRENERSVEYIKSKNIHDTSTIDWYDYMQYMNYYPKITVTLSSKVEASEKVQLQVEIDKYYNKSELEIIVA